MLCDPLNLLNSRDRSGGLRGVLCEMLYLICLLYMNKCIMSSGGVLGVWITFFLCVLDFGSFFEVLEVLEVFCTLYR